MQDTVGIAGKPAHRRSVRIEQWIIQSLLADLVGLAVCVIFGDAVAMVVSPTKVIETVAVILPLRIFFPAKIVHGILAGNRIAVFIDFLNLQIRCLQLEGQLIGSYRILSRLGKQLLIDAAGIDNGAGHHVVPKLRPPLKGQRFSRSCIVAFIVKIVDIDMQRIAFGLKMDAVMTLSGILFEP